MYIPNKTVAIIPTIANPGLTPPSFNDIKKIIRTLSVSRKREWFDANFYKCLPLSIGNMQGFVISVPFDFSVIWDGTKNPDSIKFIFNEEEKEYHNKWLIQVKSHFGYGIITIVPSFMLRTPKGVNLMTIAPPNFPTPGLSPMTGVIESDNLRFFTTFNIKIDLVNTWIHIQKDAPLVGIIPIPRYFCDEFNLVDGTKILAKEEIECEQIIAEEHDRVRHFLSENGINSGQDGLYFLGKDIRGNKFDDHQLPKIKKESDL
jgi:hypothetical protein